MGFLDRLRGSRPDDDTPGSEAGGAEQGGSPLMADGPGSDDGIEPVEEIGIRALTPAEEEALEVLREAYPGHGIDPADLSSIARAFDRAVERQGEADTASVIDVLATAIGDHLVSAGGYRWVVSTDPFGTDLAVEPPRRGVPVVTRMLVAVRWMARERGWVPGVVGHLVRIGRA